MRLVLQRTRTDCGLAVVAMITQRPYREVLRAAVDTLDYPPRGPYSTETADLRQLLAVFGVRASGLRAFRGFEKLGDRAVLLVNYSPPTRPGHWIAFERGRAGARVYDPGWWLKHPVHSQLNRLKVANYVALEMAQDQQPLCRR